MNNPTGAQFDIGLRAVRKGDGSWGSSSVDLYMMRYDDPDDAQRLLRRFWEISDFPESQLVESLKTTADTVIDDDYTEFLRGSTLLKAALAMLGFQSPEKIDAALQAGNCLSEKTAGVAALFQMPRTGYLVPLAEKFSRDFPAVEFAFMLAEAARLLLRAENFLRNWGRGFARIVDRHPAPMQSIANVTGIAMRGEALLTDSYRSTHRSFTNCENTFMALVDDANGDNNCARDAIWRKKRMRILDELGGR